MAEGGGAAAAGAEAGGPKRRRRRRRRRGSARAAGGAKAQGVSESGPTAGDAAPSSAGTQPTGIGATAARGRGQKRQGQKRSRRKSQKKSQKQRQKQRGTSDEASRKSRGAPTKREISAGGVVYRRDGEEIE